MSRDYLAELGRVMLAVECATGAGRTTLDEGLARAVDLIRRQTAAGRKVIFVGNGGSAAIASHQAVDFWRNGGMRAVAFNDPALLTCIANDFGYEAVFEKPLEMFADRDDVVITISSSGKSANILRAAEAAVRLGARLITMSGFAADNPLRQRGEINFYVPSHAYGLVEITHLALCHCIVDTIVATR